MEYPAEFQGMSPEALTELGISKIITLTSTYDHRVIQGAESGDFLRRLHALLLGEDGFYDEVFRSLRIPYEPVRWMPDVAGQHRGADRQGSPRHRGHRVLPAQRPPHGRHRPARVQGPHPPRPRHPRARADPVGPRPQVPGRRLRRRADDGAARHPRRAAQLLLPHRRRGVHAHHRPRGARVAAEAGRGQRTSSPTARSRSTSSAGSTPPRPSRPSCRRSTSARSGSASRAASR